MIVCVFPSFLTPHREVKNVKHCQEPLLYTVLLPGSKSMCSNGIFIFTKTKIESETVASAANPCNVYNIRIF